MPLIVAPQAAGLPTTPYLTVAEYRSSPLAVDTSAILVSGSPQEQDDALATQIARASSWMDRQVHYVLGATIDTETAHTRIQRDGCVCVTTRGIPILEVDTFEIGPQPGLLAAVDTAAAASYAWIEDNTIRMPAAVAGGRDGVSWATGLGSWVYAKWIYVNGYANTLMAAAVTDGASTITVRNALGIYAGTSLTIYDSGLSENVVVDASYAGGTTLPLTAPLTYSHSADVSVSALPPAIKQAAIHATNGYIRDRGADTLSMSTLEVQKGASTEPGLDDLEAARDLLSTFVLPTF